MKGERRRAARSRQGEERVQEVHVGRLSVQGNDIPEQCAARALCVLDRRRHNRRERSYDGSRGERPMLGENRDRQQIDALLTAVLLDGDACQLHDTDLLGDGTEHNGRAHTAADNIPADILHVRIMRRAVRPWYMRDRGVADDSAHQ